MRGLPADTRRADHDPDLFGGERSVTDTELVIRARAGRLS